MRNLFRLALSHKLHSILAVIVIGSVNEKIFQILANVFDVCADLDKEFRQR